MTYIDAVILDLTEWACRRFQVVTGRTNVWLAVQLTNLSIILYFLWAMMSFWNDVSMRFAVGLFCAGLSYILTQTVLKDPIELHENAAYMRVAKGLRNPRRLRDAVLRTSFLTLSLVLSYPVVLVYVNLRMPIVALTYSLIVLTTLVLYLLACDPLPPCVGRLQAWLAGIAPARAWSRSLQPQEPDSRAQRLIATDPSRGPARREPSGRLPPETRARFREAPRRDARASAARPESVRHRASTGT